jgi:ammonia channel protein AmtB
MLWSFSIILILYFVLRYFGLHRVTPSDEEIGLDMALHNQKAYRHCDSKREKSTGY